MFRGRGRCLTQALRRTGMYWTCQERRRTISLSSTAFIKVGDKIPSVDLYEELPSNRVNTYNLAANKKVIFFGVPGAFTPACSRAHLPGFVQDAEALKAKHKVHEIVCVSVNDPFVMTAWGKEHQCGGKVRMLADPNAIFTRALNLGIDITPLGGLRSKRFSMVVENGMVKELNVEPDGTSLTVSLASNIGKTSAKQQIYEVLEGKSKNTNKKDTLIKSTNAVKNTNLITTNPTTTNTGSAQDTQNQKSLAAPIAKPTLTVTTTATPATELPHQPSRKQTTSPAQSPTPSPSPLTAPADPSDTAPPPTQNL